MAACSCRHQAAASLLRTCCRTPSCRHVKGSMCADSATTLLHLEGSSGGAPAQYKAAWSLARAPGSLVPCEGLGRMYPQVSQRLELQVRCNQDSMSQRWHPGGCVMLSRLSLLRTKKSGHWGGKLMPLGRRKDNCGTKTMVSTSPHIVAASLRAMSVALSLECTASKATGVTLNMAARCVPKHVVVVRPWLGRRSPVKGVTDRMGLFTRPRYLGGIWEVIMSGDGPGCPSLLALHCLMQVLGKQQLRWICVVETYENCLHAHCMRSQRSGDECSGNLQCGMAR